MEESMSSDCCWICLDETATNDTDNPLLSVCKCPSKVHRKCLANWQLHNIGKPEEQHCRFCKDHFPEWKDLYKPSSSDTRQIRFKVHYNGRSYSIPVDPSDKEQFERSIRKAFRINPVMDINVTYICNMPDNENVITFSSSGITPHEYESAAHLAAYTRKNRTQTRNSGVQVTLPSTIDEERHSIMSNISRFMTRILRRQRA